MLSKSRFVSGAQCEKKLFFDAYREDLKPPTTEAKQAIFDTGHTVGALAQQAYPGGMDASEYINGDWDIALNRTKQWLTESIQTIYEATFSTAGGFAALDILHHHNGERWAIEVKSSGSIKDYYITDASYQYYVMKQAGFTPDKMFLMYIDKDYIKKGEIDPIYLFKIEDITEKVIKNQKAVEKKQSQLLAMLNAKVEPTCKIGKQCSYPFDCDYKHYCWAHLPENNVFDLYLSGEKGWELYQKGIYSITDIPDDTFKSVRQRVQIKGTNNNEVLVDNERLNEFLSTFTAPLYFFDFETINPTLPVLDGTNPFQQVPFQYSLHVTDIEGQITDHREFLARPEDFRDEGAVDPRRKLLDQLKKDIPSEGTIIAYYASFEISRLKELAEVFPEENDYIDSLIARVVDLLVPFKVGWYFAPSMKGSNSIKSVLPAIDPSYSYKDLEITNGTDASDIYLSMVMGEYKGDYMETSKDLLAYCKRDSEGMVVIYKYLKSIL